jgi:hypothetical protein
MGSPRRERRRFILMCDYFAGPIWWTRSRAGRLDEIPVSAGTRDALRQWSEAYDELANTDFEWPDEHAKAAFCERGRALWMTVREELGDDWEVGYWDEELADVVWPDRR